MMEKPDDDDDDGDDDGHFSSVTKTSFEPGL